MRTDISPTEFVIHIKLYTSPIQYINIHVTYPEEYPEITPEIEIEVGEKWIKSKAREDGAESDEEEYDEDEEEEEEEEEVNENQHIAPALLELTSSDMFELHKKANEIAEDNIGMPSVFTIASEVKEGAEEIVALKLVAAEKQREQEILRQEAEERKKFEGTPVTKESFEKWRIAFRKEMKVDQMLNKYIVYDKNGQPKLTGRQMFESGMLDDEEGEEDDEEDVDGLAQGVSKVAVA